MDNLPPLSQSLIDRFVGSAHGDFETVKKLLAEEPRLLNANASWQEYAIEAAAQTAQVDIVNFLLAAGAPMDICTAAMLGDVGQVQVFLSANPEAIKARGAHGIPLLYFPVITGKREIAELLYTKGADLNAGEGGTTPLHGAVMFARDDMVEWLLAKGARPDLLNYEGKTPLDIASENKQDRIVSLFNS